MYHFFIFKRLSLIHIFQATATQLADSTQIVADKLMEEAIANADGLDKLSPVSYTHLHFLYLVTDKGNLLFFDKIAGKVVRKFKYSINPMANATTIMSLSLIHI